MVEDSNNQNGDAQQAEDSVTAPLTNAEGKGVTIDMKSDDSDEPSVSVSEVKGLTKEELMKFANDPFWVRIRWLFMILFWASWVAMLVIAILIIMWAPSCDPPPSSTWLQQETLVQGIDPATANLTALGVSSLFIPRLISQRDYKELNPELDKDTVMSTLTEATAKGMKVVTHFMSGELVADIPWLTNHSDALLHQHTTTLNLSATSLREDLEGVFKHWAAVYNVTGFLVDESDYATQPLIKNLTKKLNDDLNPDIAFGGPLVDITEQLLDMSDLSGLKDILKQGDSQNWTYYQVPTYQMIPEEAIRPVLLALMMSPGTPLLQMKDASQADSFSLKFGNTVDMCNELRKKEAILYGDTQVANTTESLFAFTRAMKGTPGYAVAINVYNETQVVDFSKLDHVPKTGTLAMNLQEVKDGGLRQNTKVDMDKIEVPALSGMMVQFVAQFDED